MPRESLNYQRPMKQQTLRDPLYRWYRSDVLCVVVALLAIVAANAWLLSRDGSLLAAFAAPLFNVLVGLALLAFTPVVRTLSGTSARAYIWAVATGGVIAAVVATLIAYSTFRM
jgi:hypothetical protein